MKDDRDIEWGDIELLPLSEADKFEMARISAIRDQNMPKDRPRGMSLHVVPGHWIPDDSGSC